MRAAALLAAVLLTAAAPLAAAQNRPAPTPRGSVFVGEPIDAAAMLTDARGRNVGRAEFKSGPDGVLIRLTTRGLQAQRGWHGMHIHAVGDCAGPKFTSAGAHVHDGPTGAHGLLNPNGPEAGDLPNLYVLGDGSSAAEVHTTRVKLVDLLDGDGSAILIHAGPDDHRTQPIGGSGDRIACGVIRSTR
jgi:Cu-Zn family superoxide dismutase